MAQNPDEYWVFKQSLTPRLTGAGSRRLEGTNTGHENAEGMASVGVRVEPTVRLGRGVEGRDCCHGLDLMCSSLVVFVGTRAIGCSSDICLRLHLFEEVNQLRYVVRVYRDDDIILVMLFLLEANMPLGAYIDFDFESLFNNSLHIDSIDSTW
jgi:hypothetical protein